MSTTLHSRALFLATATLACCFAPMIVQAQAQPQTTSPALLRAQGIAPISVNVRDMGAVGDAAQRRGIVAIEPIIFATLP